MMGKAPAVAMNHDDDDDNNNNNNNTAIRQVDTIGLGVVSEWKQDSQYMSWAGLWLLVPLCKVMFCA